MHGLNALALTLLLVYLVGVGGMDVKLIRRAAARLRANHPEAWERLGRKTFSWQFLGFVQSRRYLQLQDPELTELFDFKRRFDSVTGILFIVLAIGLGSYMKSHRNPAQPWEAASPTPHTTSPPAHRNAFIERNPVLFWSLACGLFFVAAGALTVSWSRRANRKPDSDTLAQKTEGWLSMDELVGTLLLTLFGMMVGGLLPIANPEAELVPGALAGFIAGVLIFSRRRRRSHENARRTPTTTPPANT
jgi:hypothetical protein